MRSKLSTTWAGKGTARVGFALLAFGALLLAGCVAPAAPSAFYTAQGAEGGFVAASMAARSSSSPSPSASAAGCQGQEILVDHQELLTGGNGGRRFNLAYPCLLKAELSLNTVGGNVRVWVMGLGGTVFDERATAVVAPAVFVWYGHRDADDGVQPPGQYQYGFDVDGAADFDFRILAGR